MIASAAPGSRFRSAVCDVEVIVIKAPSTPLDLRCGGHEMVPMGSAVPEGLKAMPGFDNGTQIGKRYVDESGELELLCTKGGTSSLSLGETVLEMKEAKPLPSSD